MTAIKTAIAEQRLASGAVLRLEHAFLEVAFGEAAVGKGARDVEIVANEAAAVERAFDKIDTAFTYDRV